MRNRIRNISEGNASSRGEGRQMDRIFRTAESLERKYKPYMRMFEDHSQLSRLRGVTPFDKYALGRILEQWSGYQQMHEQNGSISDLGQLPKIALEVITVSYGQSIIPYMASVQDIDDEVGIVWFKQLVAKDTRGNLTADQTIYDPKNGMPILPIGYASEKVSGTFATATAVGVEDYVGVTLPGTPILPLRPGTVTVSIPALSLSATDSTENPGFGAGPGIQFTVNYETGVFDINLIDDPLGVHAIQFAYSQNFEAATDIPEVQYEFTSTNVQAEIFALKALLGLLKMYAIQKRFGMIGEEEIAKDLTNELNAEVGGTVISRLYDSAIATLPVIPADQTFVESVPPGISEAEHRQSFKFRVAAAETKIVSQARRGIVNVIIGGREFCEIASTVPGFQLIANSTSTIGPHVYGMLDGRLIIRVAQDNIIPSKEAVCMWKGVSAFETPVVYAPYMPLMVTTPQPLGGNPLMSQKAAAVWAAIKVLVPQFITRMQVV